LTKLKLLESALSNLAATAKNAGPLNDLFDTMKEGSMITAPWQTFLNMLGAETTKSSIGTIKSLFAILKDPNTQTTIQFLADSFSGLISEAGKVITSVTNLTTALINLGNQADGTRDKVKVDVFDVINVFAELLTILGLLRDRTAEWGDRLTGLGEGMQIPESGGTYQGGGGR